MRARRRKPGRAQSSAQRAADDCAGIAFIVSAFSMTRYCIAYSLMRLLRLAVSLLLSLRIGENWARTEKSKTPTLYLWNPSLPRRSRRSRLRNFWKEGTGKAAEKFTEAAIAKMDSLRKQIWAKLHGRARVEAVKATVETTQQITQAEVNQLAAYLQVAMDEDPQFAQQIQAIAHEITLMQIEDNSSMTQVNYGGTNYQTKQGQTIRISLAVLTITIASSL